MCEFCSRTMQLNEGSHSGIINEPISVGVELDQRVRVGDEAS